MLIFVIDIPFLPKVVPLVIVLQLALIVVVVANKHQDREQLNEERLDVVFVHVISYILWHYKLDGSLDEILYLVSDSVHKFLTYIHHLIAQLYSSFCQSSCSLEAYLSCLVNVSSFF